MKQGQVHSLITPDELNADMIRQVYGVEAVLAEVEGHRVVIPRSATPREPARPATRSAT